MEITHIALIGTGGIGKTSIAKALLNHGSIVSYFGGRLFYVTFDGVSSSAISYQSFINNLAEACGISVKTENAIVSHLRSSKSLLVLDNAETFLEAQGNAGGRISQALSDIGSLQCVQLLLTTRSRKLPSNLRWTCVHVRGLEKDAARLAFSHGYIREPVGQNIDDLLSVLEFHPLSINLLSHVASQNRWSLEKLRSEFVAQQTHLLEAGQHKLQSLSITIELSVNSSAFHAIQKSVIVQLLRAIAFFPRGIHDSDLEGIFRNIKSVRVVVDALCRCSLTYRSGGFVNMLAPIRMYITDNHDGNFSRRDSLLISARHYYIQQLRFQTAHCVQQNYTHLERILAYDLSDKILSEEHPKALIEALHDIRYFARYLSIYNPQTVHLFHLLVNIPDTWFGKEYQPTTLSTQHTKLLTAKAEAMYQTCWIPYRQNFYLASLELLETTAEFCRRYYNICRIILAKCLYLKGQICVQQGRLQLAETSLREGISHIPTSPDRHKVQNDLNISLAEVALRQGKLIEAESLALSMKLTLESEKRTNWMLYNILACLSRISTEKRNFSSARAYREEGMRINRVLKGSVTLEDTRALADIAFRDQRVIEAHSLLDGILVSEAPWTEIVHALNAKAYYDSRNGDSTGARSHLIRAQNIASSAQKSTRRGTLLVFAYVEMFAGELSESRLILENFQRKYELFKDSETWILWAHRALGEISVLQNDPTSAEQSFQKTKSLCDDMGIPATCLYNGWPIHASLPDTYRGWPSFLGEGLSD